MHFDKGFIGRSLTEIPHVKLNGMTIESVSKFKYLGVLIDNKLHFDHHMTYCIKNASHTGYLHGKSKKLFKSKIISYNV